MGALENQTRKARVLVTVPDPLSRRSGSRDLPPLMIGAFMEASIQAKEIADVIRLKRDYICKDESGWMMEEGALRIRDVDIVFRDAEYAYIASGLSNRDQITLFQ